jgi:hypothetical protein
MTLSPCAVPVGILLAVAMRLGSPAAEAQKAPGAREDASAPVRQQAAQGHEALPTLAARLIAPKTRLDPGEHVTDTIEITGLQRLSVPVIVRIRNETPEIVALGGGNTQVVTIRPSDVDTAAANLCARNAAAKADSAGSALSKNQRKAILDAEAKRFRDKAADQDRVAELEMKAAREPNLTSDERTTHIAAAEQARSEAASDRAQAAAAEQEAARTAAGP